jgi:hypothetical protein
MNDTVHNLVAAIKTGDALATEQAFASAMAEKLASKIEDLRVNIAQNMFDQVQDNVNESQLPGGHQAAMIAHKVAGSAKGMQVSSYGSQHFIHHSGDDSKSVIIQHKENKFHVTHDDGQINDTKSFDNANDAHKHAHTLVHGVKEEFVEISQEELEEAMTKFGAMKSYIKNKEVYDDKTGNFGTTSKQRADSGKVMKQAKKVIKKHGGDMSRVNQAASDYNDRRNSV